MRLPALVVSLAASLGLSGCAVSSPGQSSSATWTTGFWFWRGTSTREVWTGPPLDVVFVRVGTIRGERIYCEWPKDMPDAKEYWMVLRYDRQAVPDPDVVTVLTAEVSRLWRLAKLEHLNVAGVQLDIDSPTSQLASYASFLREVRKGLPKDCQLSVTALLDWFRSGTNVGQVIRVVDEFVPQFYDTASGDFPNDAVIASRIDAARWGPVFNSFGKRFRLGISSFGRAQMVRREIASSTRYRGIGFYQDLTPLDIATNPHFQLVASGNPANEVVLNYTAAQKIKISYTNFNPGDGIRFILATPDSIRSAAENARQIKGNLAGILFFRWPTDNETLAMQPDEVLAAAGIASQGQRRNRIDTIDGHCAAVDCVDVYLKSGSPFSSSPVRYRIRASTQLEYFLPEKNMPVRLKAPSELELSLPPYCARGRLFLGRAVSAHHSDFTVEEER